MAQSLELPTELFEALQKTAQANGISPVEWIASMLPPSASKEKNIDLWKELVGVFDSRDGLHAASPRTPFGDLIAAKLERQGITRPK
jgi:hypothetical protein